MTDGARAHSKMSLVALNKDFDVKTLVFFNFPNYAVSSSVTDQYHEYGVMCVIRFLLIVFTCSFDIILDQ